MEWSSIPLGLPLSDEGIWLAHTNAQEDALRRARSDCVQLQPKPASFALRSYNLGSSASAGPSSNNKGSGQRHGSNPLGYGHWQCLAWQSSALATADALWLFSEEGYVWVCLHDSMVGGDAGLLRRRRVWSLLLISGGRAQKRRDGGRPVPVRRRRI